MFKSSRRILNDGIIPILKESNHPPSYFISLIRNKLAQYKISPFKYTFIKVVPFFPLEDNIKGVEIISVGQGFKIFDQLCQTNQRICCTGIMGRQTKDFTENGILLSSKPYHNISLFDLKTALELIKGEKCYLLSDDLESSTHDSSKTHLHLNSTSIDNQINFQSNINSTIIINIKNVEIIKFQPPFFQLDFTLSGSLGNSHQGRNQSLSIKSVIHKIGQILYPQKNELRSSLQGIGAALCLDRNKFNTSNTFNFDNIFEQSGPVRYNFGPFNLSDCLKESDIKDDLMNNMDTDEGLLIKTLKKYKVDINQNNYNNNFNIQNKELFRN
ncbi:unnamed protein product [Gordionus sp. m RMFG-2023]|uniref:uncharacterized protein LOC135929889 n=1 Tax=Gordionus sp. m RMFG-2023 TaxID=3053472 RepID=UPI0030E0A4B4